jgi:uncharacterized membrane protein required for colicin V production
MVFNVYLRPNLLKMSYSSIIGSLGVTLLLAAFFLSLFRYITQESRLYIFLNIIGAGLSCYASVLIRYWPFVVLEGCWGLVALAALRGKKQRAVK